MAEAKEIADGGRTGRRGIVADGAKLVLMAYVSKMLFESCVSHLVMESLFSFCQISCPDS